MTSFTTFIRASRIALAIAGLAGAAVVAEAKDGPRTVRVNLGAYKNVVYVSAVGGADQAGRGTREAPWASVGAALAAAARTGQPTAILVAEGDYPTENLQLVSGVDLFGGFDAADWSRDVWAHRTTLAGKGTGRVLVAADMTTLDGFEIRGGVVRGAGAGIRIDGTAPVISNNIFTANKTLGPANWKPKYWHETANDGGAVYCTNGGAPVVTDNLFVGNKTENGRGAAIALNDRCKGRIAGNVIMDNIAGTDDPMRSSDGGGGSTPSSGTYIKAKVDGTWKQTYSIQGYSAGVAVSTGSGLGRVIQISGANDQGATNSFAIYLIRIDAIGTYQINSDSDSVMAYLETNTSTSWDTSDCAEATGTLKVTTLTSEKIEGTFSFTGKVDEDCSNSKSITEGSFRGVFMGN